MEAIPWKKSAKGVESTPSSSCSIAYLPNPLLMEILSRVSIKTLTTSKSVCKSWLNLIEDPQFCQMHHRRSPTEVCFQPYHGNGLELHLGNFHFPNNLDPCHFQIPNFSVKPNNSPNYNASQRNLNFANSCNGLLCYYSDNPSYRFAVVWNPCTGEFITFPPSTALHCLGYGLGFSGKENKFKLLRLIREGSRSDTVVADVCAIEKSCSWKRVGPCYSHAWFRDYSGSREGEVRDLHAVFLQGTLHWVGVDSRKSCAVIPAFDFEDDRFVSVPLPHCLNIAKVDDLGVLDGCLFIAAHHSDKMLNRILTIWLMKEYGVQDSWTKLFSLGSTREKGSNKGCKNCLPITYMDNGEILMKCSLYETESSTVIVDNPVLKRARVMGSCPASLRVIAYKPSLVRLKDSMLGYDVHAIPRCPEAGLERGEMSKALDWWKPGKNTMVAVDDEENLNCLTAYEKAKTYEKANAVRYARDVRRYELTKELRELEEMDMAESQLEE